MAEQAIKTQLEEHKLILSTREKEFENLKRDRQMLLRDEERLMSLFTMGEDRLAETEYVKTLKLSIEHYRDRCYHLEQRRIDIERDMDKMSATRQQLVEQVKSEKIAQGITMEAEMRRLEGDLNRIRGQRDHFQLLVEEQKIKEGREKESQEKIISFANQGKLRVASLEARISKLKTEQEMAGPFAKEANTFNSLKDSIQ
jgi:E3 ubiquitin-protein ligase BRE1